MPRRASIHNKRDANEPKILAALAQMGAVWIEAGPLDGWAVINGKFIPIEIKNPEGRNIFQSEQLDFINLCKLHGLPYLIVRSVDDVVNALNALRRQA